jgi:hypothetical protein
MAVWRQTLGEITAFKYRAFLSYSHRDAKWGTWLHAALERFSIDKDVIGRETPAGPVPKTLRPIFRDREDFAAGPSLPAQTVAALEASQFLIVICSPNSAQSKYVNEEIRRFKALGRAHNIIPVIVDGEPHDPARECFPPALAFRVGPDGMLTDEREEPIAADARPNRDGKDIAKLKVVAGLLGAGLDEIVRRAERARRKRVRNWSAALILLTVTFAGIAIWAEFNRREADSQRNHAQQETIQARKNLSSALTALALVEWEQRPVEAAKLAIAAWPRPGAMNLPKPEMAVDTITRFLSGLHERSRIVSRNMIASVALSPDGGRVLTGSRDDTARLWDAATGKELRAFKGHEHFVRSVAFSPNGIRVLTGSSDDTAHLWDAATGRELRAFKGHQGSGWSIAFSPDGMRVLTGSGNSIAHLWDAATGEELRAFRGHGDSVTSVAFSPGGGHVLTGSGDNTARLWDVATGKEIRAFKGHEGSVSSVAFSPDGKRVLTGSEDGTARLWDISGIPKGSIFDIACAWLPDHDLSGLGKEYGLDLSHEAPICRKDAGGNFNTPLPDPLPAE